MEERVGAKREVLNTWSPDLKEPQAYLGRRVEL